MAVISCNIGSKNEVIWVVYSVEVGGVIQPQKG